ncbi:MAG TPA: MFS transporter [Candidatus Saccharimonadales bacterium]|nr:MFS transporter [Candidatus Saccharimonadales bacterium]
MQLLAKLRGAHAHLVLLNTLHILNDGYQASFMLLLPFISKSSHLSLTKVGSLGTVLNLTALAIVIPASGLARRLGSLRTLLLALFVYATGFLGASLAGTYIRLVMMFIVSGLGYGIFHPLAFGLIAKWSPKETLGRTMGNFTAIGDVGRIGISAALSFLIVHFGWRHTTLLYVLLAFTTGLVIVLYMRKNSDRITPPERPIKQKLTAWQILKSPRYIYAVAANALDSFASDSLYVFLPFLLLHRGIHPALLGSFTAAFFFGNIFGKTLLGRVADRVGKASVFISAEVLMALFIFLLAGSSAAWAIISCAIVLGVFTKGTQPVQKSMIAEAVEHHGNYDKAFSLATLASNTTKTIAPITLGFIASTAGIVWTFNTMAIVVLAAAIPGTLFYLSKKPVLDA